MNVVCAILIHDNRILVGQRPENKRFGTKWEFPGGKCKPGETPQEALHREIREELAITIEIVCQLPAVSHNYAEFTIQLIPFVCRPLSTQIMLSEHSGILWLNPAELNRIDLTDADRILLEREYNKLTQIIDNQNTNL